RSSKIVMVSEKGGDYVNRTGALAQRDLRIAVGLHASENVVGAHLGRIVVEFDRQRCCAAGNQGESQQKTDARNACNWSHRYMVLERRDAPLRRRIVLGACDSRPLGPC